jgi:hypothetical protein
MRAPSASFEDRRSRALPGRPVRRCRCGCGLPLQGMRPEALYASPACRLRDWKARHGVGARNASETAQKGRPRTVELRVSLRKAQQVADRVIAELEEPLSRAQVRLVVRAVLMQALSDRQREALAGDELYELAACAASTAP